MIELPEQVAAIKARIEQRAGHVFDPVHHTDAGVWEMRYVNGAGIHIFSTIIRHNGKRWRAETVTGVKITGDLLQMM